MQDRKLQTSSFKLQESLKLQTQGFELEAWGLKFLWSLEFGVWNL